jgi:Zn-dependent protease
MDLEEVVELGRSTFYVALIFTIASGLGSGLVGIAITFTVALICAGAGFFIHELMHKFAAKTLGFASRYRGSSFPLISILIAFAGWILLAPGAVEIIPRGRMISRRISGMISLAGPTANLALALAFYALSLHPDRLVSNIMSFGHEINIWLALFNLVPAPGFDGKKVLDWSKVVYAITAIIFLAIFLIL